MHINEFVDIWTFGSTQYAFFPSILKSDISILLGLSVVTENLSSIIKVIFASYPECVKLAVCVLAIAGVIGDLFDLPYN